MTSEEKAESDRWWDDRWQRKRATATGERTKWLAAHPTDVPPGLEFPPPDCTVCGLTTYFDGDVHRCDDCGISWDSADVGRWDLCEATQPLRGVPWHEKPLCHLRKAHDGACTDGEATWDDPDEMLA